jgi:hypothetical protein
VASVCANGTRATIRNALILAPTGGVSSLTEALNPTAPGWVPANTSLAAMNGISPSEVSGEPRFFDTSASYRGAFMPAGVDWSAGWTAYPER